MSSNDDERFRMQLEKHFALYRLNLRLPLVSRIRLNCWYRIDLLLVNELGLFRRADLEPNGRVRVTCALEGCQGTIEVREHGNGFEASGKGVLEYRVTHLDTKATTSSLYLTLSVSKVENVTGFQHVMPLTVGPIVIDPDAPLHEPSDALVEEWPANTDMVHDTYRILNHVWINESWDAGIPGKIWDSAIVMLAFLELLYNKQGKLGHVIDLSAGTGLLGLFLARNKAADQITITELDEALPLIEHNVKLNHQQDKIKIKPLLWGDEIQSAAVGKADVIVASDVLYESEFFTDLAKTLEDLSTRDTSIYIGYKRRGLDQDEEERFWSLCRDHNLSITLLNTSDPTMLPDIAKITNVQIYRLTPLYSPTV